MGQTEHLAELVGQYHSLGYYARLGVCSDATLRRAIHAGELRHLRVGRGDPRRSRIRISETDFRDWLRAMAPQPADSGCAA